jgi:SAM-dependent methyltransferase
MRDKTKFTLLEPTYFFQDTWAAGKIFQAKPDHHYDVGSSVKTMGILSQFIPVTMVDIRPVDLKLKNLNFKRGSIIQLPFYENSIDSLSSLCVVEHIGLGRYGDIIDPWGSEKAIDELQRVLKSGGDLYVSVPVHTECRVYFNAHRAFTRKYIMELFGGIRLIEEKYIYGRVIQDCYEQSKGFGTGLFHFRKEKR